MKALKAIGGVLCFAGIGMTCGTLTDPGSVTIAGMFMGALGTILFIAGRFGDG